MLLYPNGKHDVNFVVWEHATDDSHQLVKNIHSLKFQF